MRKCPILEFHSRQAIAILQLLAKAYERYIRGWEVFLGVFEVQSECKRHAISK